MQRAEWQLGVICIKVGMHTMLLRITVRIIVVIIHINIGLIVGIILFRVSIIHNSKYNHRYN